MIFFKQTTFLLFIGILPILSSCKKDNDPAPDNSYNNSNNQNIIMVNNGSYVKGTIVTSMSDDTPITFSFNHVYGTSRPTSNDTIFWYFQDLNSYVTTLSQYSGVRMDLDSINDPNPKKLRLYLGATTQLGDNKVFQFLLNSSAGIPFTLTNYKYDATDQSISGDFTLTTSTTANGKSATVTGSFKIVGMVDVVYRKALSGH